MQSNLGVFKYSSGSYSEFFIAFLFTTFKAPVSPVNFGAAAMTESNCTAPTLLLIPAFADGFIFEEVVYFRKVFKICWHY